MNVFKLTPEEEGLLADVLAAHSDHDLHGAVGLMHAVVTAPVRIAFSEWCRLLERPGSKLGPLERTERDRLLCIACRIVDIETSRRRPFVPAAHDAAACSSFARGYLAGLELWPNAIPRLDRLRCAAWACALGGRLDLLPPGDRAALRLTEQGRAQLRAEIARFLLLAHDLWREAA